MSNRSEAVVELMSRLIANQPFFAVYLMDMMKIVETTDLPTAATDGSNIYLNPDFMAGLPMPEREFVLCHEVLHGIYMHMPRIKMYQDRGFGPDLKPFDMKKYNRAADYIINATLKECAIGSMPSCGLYDTSISSADLTDDVYCKLPDDEGDGSDGGQDGGHGGFDEHMMPDDPSAQPGEAEVKRGIASARNAAKAQGNMPGALERLVDTLMDPVISWPDYLRNELLAKVGHDTTTWAKANRRRLSIAPHVYMPGATGYQIGGLAIVIDTSGSVSQHELQRFMSETASILVECQPEWLKVLWTDSQVAGEDDVDDAEMLTELTPKGGGGTRMPAAFDYIEEHGLEPETCIVLTDGYTDFGDQPPYSVIWGITNDHIKAPWGVSLHIDEEH